METRKLSNLYTPCITKRFAMSSCQNFDLQEQILHRRADEEMMDDDIPIGIIDSWRTNDQYKSLIQAFNITQFENVEALKMIEEEIKKIDEELEGYWASDSCIMKDIYAWAEDQNWISEEGLQAIYLWRTTRLSLSSIAFKTSTKLEEVTAYVTAYKKKVRKQLKI